MTCDDIIHFWFNELEPKDWFTKNTDLDNKIYDKFLATHQKAIQCEFFHWRETPLGRLAEIIVLDQFSRNIFRDSAKAFVADPLALALAQEAVRLKCDQELEPQERTFLYMPYMHSESKDIHKISLKLFSQPGLNPEYELKHKAIIDRFGRYPHRNQVLARTSTLEEIEFLKQPGSSF